MPYLVLPHTLLSSGIYNPKININRRIIECTQVTAFMGISTSKVNSNALRELSKSTNFDYDEVKALFTHFGAISGSEVDDGLIDQSEMKRALGLRGDLFAERLFGLFDLDHDGVVNFAEFVQGLSVFSPQASIEEKLKRVSPPPSL